MGLYYNGTLRVQFKGGTMIPAGEAREIPDHLMPGHVAPDAPAPEQVNSEFDPALLQALPLAEFKKQLEILTVDNGLSKSQLKAVKALENRADKPRKGVIDLLDFALLALEI